MTTPFGPRATARDVLAGVDLTGRRYVVTGGSSGIGAEAVAALAAAGAEVVVGVRDLGRARAFVDAQAAQGRNVSAAALDLGDLRSVRRFAEGWNGSLDGLVANAGVMALPDRRATDMRWELQLATNYLGHFALAIGLRGALASRGGRVAVVSSSAHLRAAFDFEDPQFARRPYDRWTAYAQSKTADVLLAVGIAQQWTDDGITANALMPGWITTDLQRHLDAATLRAMGAMNDAGDRIEQDYFKTREQGAATTVLVAASPLLEAVTGLYFEDNQQAPIVHASAVPAAGVAEHAMDAAAAARLWEYSSSVLGAS